MDVASAALQAVSRGSANAPVLAFAAGVAGSVGPCAAPRLLATTSCCINRSLRESALVAFSLVAGVMSTYVLFALAGSLIWEAFRHSSEIYVAGAVLMAAAGFVTVLKPPPECAHFEKPLRRSSGSMFLLGASSALIVSPCCAPVLLASIAYAGVAGLWFSCASVACFALGHALPVSLMAFGSGSLRPILTRWDAQGAATMIGGSLLLALAGYYAVLA